MEFSSIWYFTFWSLVSVVFSTTGIHALRKATIPVSDLVKSQLVFYSVSSVSISTFYAFLFRPALEHDQDLNAAHRIKIMGYFYADFLIVYSGIILFRDVPSTEFTNLEQKLLAVLILVLYVVVTPNIVKSIRKRFKYSQAIGNLLPAITGPLYMYPNHTLCCCLSIIFWLLLVRYVILPGLGNYDSQSIVSNLFIISFCSIYVFYIKLLITSTVAAQANEHQKIIEIVIGILGTTLAQYYFRVKSMSLMLGLLSWSIAWLGILANVQPRTDFGIFHFLVTASLECAVSLFGLHFYTFLVVCGGIVLIVLRWKLEFVSLRHSGRKERMVRDWKRLEELYSNDSNDSSILTHDLEQPGASNTQRLGIQRRLTQRFERLWSPFARPLEPNRLNGGAAGLFLNLAEIDICLERESH